MGGRPQGAGPPIVALHISLATTGDNAIRRPQPRSGPHTLWAASQAPVCCAEWTRRVGLDKGVRREPVPTRLLPHGLVCSAGSVCSHENTPRGAVPVTHCEEHGPCW